MTLEFTTLTDQGSITLPPSVRQAVGLEAEQSFLIKTLKDGSILLKPAGKYDIEEYTEERIAEFLSWEPDLKALMTESGFYDKH